MHLQSGLKLIFRLYPHLLCATTSLLLFLVRINIKLVLFLGEGVA